MLFVVFQEKQWKACEKVPEREVCEESAARDLAFLASDLSHLA